MGRSFPAERSLRDVLLGQVGLAVARAGRTVLVSGAVLGACFLGLALIRQSIISTLGVGSALTIGFVMLVNLSFLPAALLVAYVTRYPRTPPLRMIGLH